MGDAKQEGPGFFTGSSNFCLNGREYSALRDLKTRPMTRVVLARQRALNRSAVIKFLSARNDLHVQSFQQEVRALSLLQHPNNVTLLDAGVEQDADGERVLFVVTEYIGGQDVRDLLLTEREIGVERAVQIALLALAGLSEAHGHGLLHGDLKPENLVLAKVPYNPNHIKLIDYGLSSAIAAREPAGPKAEMIFGTARYMAPEIIQGKPATVASDLYSLSVVLYELLAGAPPFEGVDSDALLNDHLKTPPPLLHLRANVPRGLSSLVHKGLEKRPEDRFQDTDAFYRALSGLNFSQAASATLERFPDARDAVAPDFIGERSAIALASPDHPMEIWVLTDAPGIHQELIQAALDLSAVEVRILPTQARSAMLSLLKKGRVNPPAVVVFSDLHAIIEDPLLRALDVLGLTARALLSTHLDAELLHNTLEFCGVDHILIAPISPDAFKGALRALIDRQRQRPGRKALLDSFASSASDALSSPILIPDAARP